MTTHQNSETDLPPTPETAQVELLKSIETLQAILDRLISLLNSESFEARTQSALVLENLHQEIQKILANRHIRKGKTQLECWENEGGRIGYASE
jgi:hypothetical protein